MNKTIFLGIVAIFALIAFPISQASALTGFDEDRYGNPTGWYCEGIYLDFAKGMSATDCERLFKNQYYYDKCIDNFVRLTGITTYKE